MPRLVHCLPLLLLACGGCDRSTASTTDSALDGARQILFSACDQRGEDAVRDLLLKDPQIKLAKGSGFEGGDALRVEYVPTKRGSERVTAAIALPESATEMALSYQVCFEAGFDFAKGGKLHGLGPASPITGGKTMRPEGWSARVTFQKEGGVATYLYRQDNTRKFGATAVAKKFRFLPGQWYTVVLRVRLNDAGANNGYARLSIDGKEVQVQEGVDFRARDSDPSTIQNLLFNTFHGGQSQDYTPRDAGGEPTTVYARFDNIGVYCFGAGAGPAEPPGGD